VSYSGGRKRQCSRTNDELLHRGDNNDNHAKSDICTCSLYAIYCPVQFIRTLNLPPVPALLSGLSRAGAGRTNQKPKQTKMQLELPNSRTLPYYVISASFAAIVAMWLEVRRIEEACDLKLKEQRLQCDEAMKAQEARIDEARRELDRYKTEQAQLFQKTVLDIAKIKQQQ
jgi:hypothetical protein